MRVLAAAKVISIGGCAAYIRGTFIKVDFFMANMDFSEYFE